MTGVETYESNWMKKARTYAKVFYAAFPLNFPSCHLVLLDRKVSGVARVVPNALCKRYCTTITVYQSNEQE